MLKDSQHPRYSVPRTRRTYTPQFKAELLTACTQPGASIAAVALQHGMNANVLHRWLKDHRQETPLLGDGAPAPAFIPIDMATSLPALDADREPSALSQIRIELQHHAMSVTVHWPGDAAGACAQMLRTLLR
ncbi:transposase [Pseudomonas aeruginosa]|uniref:IS66-like element accessory protein TnpA n=1 Tax=Pseudomonas aeruginosa TaxID=287 RepID=UPI0004B1CFD9|nr:transposase [Pseudomonas aeruginosa]